MNNIEKYSVKLRNKWFLVVDDKGFLCGLYKSEEKAKKAIPNIAKNVELGFIPNIKPRPIYKRKNRNLKNKKRYNK